MQTEVSDAPPEAPIEQQSQILIKGTDVLVVALTLFTCTDAQSVRSTSPHTRTDNRMEFTHVTAADDGMS